MQQKVPPHDASAARVEPTAAGAFACDILVVDDTPENLLAIEAALGDLATNLITAQSGADALRALLERDFALILLDVQMPLMDGFETARMIRERARNRLVPIIFVTAYDRDDADVLQAYQLGAVDFLFKPIRAEVLRAKAAVFVELQRRAAEVTRQAERLREHERLEHEGALVQQRRKLESEALQGRLEEERRYREEIAAKARELSVTVAELEAAKTELQHKSEFLAEADQRKDEFIAVLAHELRNPLAPIVSGLELFSDAAEGDAVLSRAHRAMTRQVHHLRRLIDDLLDVSRITSGKIELRRTWIALDDVVRQAVSMSQSLLDEREHELVCALPDDTLVLEGDQVRLAQVVANLLNNAARYTDRRGHISVSLERVGDEAIINVTDNGRGIPPELLDRVFEMFVQESAGGGGLGIGLTLVRRLVELHGGSVAVHSDTGGSVFTVRLPLSKRRTRAATANDAGPDAQMPLRIVLVEDNEDIRITMRDLLERWGHEVHEAPTGLAGIELILRERPHVALVDIGLPDIAGYDVARGVRRAVGSPPTRLIAVTGYGQERDRAMARDAGFDEHVSKPANVAQLRRALAAIEPL